MASTKTLSITLPEDLAAKVQAKVASGQFASESDVIRDSLEYVEAGNFEFDEWLRTEVAETYDRIRAGQEPMLTGEEVIRALEQDRETLKKG